MNSYLDYLYLSFWSCRIHSNKEKFLIYSVLFYRDV